MNRLRKARRQLVPRDYLPLLKPIDEYSEGKVIDLRGKIGMCIRQGIVKLEKLEHWQRMAMLTLRISLDPESYEVPKRT